ncbi:MAG: hypothetical protein KDD47_08230, partial [Acidobacteria bacterium]|nr:hypothetical protein [Acidobacteriota bacterium]
AMRSDDSPFDRFLRGDEEALTQEQQAGMRLFYGEAGCSGCHSGTFQTDHEFHAIAMPQIGPGKGDGHDVAYWQSTGFFTYIEDHGRGGVSGDQEEDYAFRTPSLRNVAVTGPWGHAGTFDSLEAVVRHHLDPLRSLESFRLEARVLPGLDSVLELSYAGPEVEALRMDEVRKASFLERDGFVQSTDSLRHRIAAANELEPLELSDREVGQLLAFLDSLTDAGALARLARTLPPSVPSGLPVDHLPADASPAAPHMKSLEAREGPRNGSGQIAESSWRTP